MRKKGSYICMCLVCKVLHSLAYHIFQQRVMWSHTIKKSFMFKIPTSLMYALSQQKNLALHQRFKCHEKMATSKDHSKVKKERKETHTYTEQPEDLIRTPSELALGASKAGSYPKQQGEKSTEAFPHVSFPPAWQQSLAHGPIGSNWSQGHEVPTFKATSRTRLSSHECQRFFVCSAPTWSVKPPR